MIRIIFIISIFLVIVSCSKEIEKKSIINEKSLDKQVLEAYNEGFIALREKDVLFAAKKFNEVEILFPQSDIAPRASLMAAYSYYSQDYYEDSILEIQRFLKLYLNHKNTDYAYYLLALCYYEQIVDEKKDTLSIIRAKEYFEYIVNKYPDTEYAIDANFKIQLIKDILAAKEMYIGRYYVDKKKWIPAINRFKSVVNDYDTTIYVEEALYRLVEIYYLLGIIQESKKYANLLGYNYQSSEWYSKSYSFFDKVYEENLLKKEKNKKSIINKAKSIFN